MSAVKMVWDGVCVSGMVVMCCRRWPSRPILIEKFPWLVAVQWFRFFCQTTVILSPAVTVVCCDVALTPPHGPVSRWHSADASLFRKVAENDPRCTGESTQRCAWQMAIATQRNSTICNILYDWPTSVLCNAFIHVRDKIVFNLSIENCLHVDLIWLKKSRFWGRLIA